MWFTNSLDKLQKYVSTFTVTEVGRTKWRGLQTALLNSRRTYPLLLVTEEVCWSVRERRISYLPASRPDITVMVDWASNTKLLTYLPASRPDMTVMVDWSSNKVTNLPPCIRAPRHASTKNSFGFPARLLQLEAHNGDVKSRMLTTSLSVPTMPSCVPCELMQQTKQL